MSGSWLIVTWAGGGNVNAALGLAQALSERGHRVGALATSSLAGRLEAAAVEVVGAAASWLPDDRDFLGTVESFHPDAVVVDYMLTGGLSAAELTGLPTVALVHTLYTALLVDGAPHPMAMAGPVGAVNSVRDRLGLAPITGFGDLLAAADLVLVTAPMQLDSPGAVPTNVRYVGALRPAPAGDAAWRPPAGDGPLVAVSMGTAGDPATESVLLGTILAALAELPVRGLVSVPDYIDLGGLHPSPNVTLSGYLDHQVVLPHAALLVTHAGLGSVLAALAHGVPMVCLPLGREQPENARAVARIGAGTALPPEAGADQIGAAITAELARRHLVRIDPDPGPMVDVLEALLAPGRRRR